MGDRQLATLSGFLKDRTTALASVMPKHLTPERLVKIAIAAASRTPKLLQCTPESIYASLHTAGQLGLEAGGPLGHAYLVPFMNGKTQRMECTFIPGYRGLVELARRSGGVSSIYAFLVHENDAFKYSLGTNPHIEHVPAIKERGAVTHVYAVAKVGEEMQFDVMTAEEVEAIRKRSKAAQSGPWVTDWGEMAKKTVLKRLCKLLPMSVELADAIDQDNNYESGKIKDAEGQIVDNVLKTPERATVDMKKIKAGKQEDHTEPGEAQEAEEPEAEPEEEEEAEPEAAPEEEQEDEAPKPAKKPSGQEELKELKEIEKKIAAVKNRDIARQMATHALDLARALDLEKDVLESSNFATAEDVGNATTLDCRKFVEHVRTVVEENV